MRGIVFLGDRNLELQSFDAPVGDVACALGLPDA